MAHAASVSHSHIACSPGIQGGEPVIKGTRFPVRSVVHHILLEGYSPEELCRQFPRLSLGAVYDALAYYYDHKKELDACFREQREEYWKKKPKI
jgi:uncharacterized protein (DUF433 family)